MSQKPAYTIGINKAASIRLSAYGFVLLFVGAALFAWLTHGGGIGTAHWALALLAYFATLVVHELVHGFFFKIFGGHPKYGVGVSYFMPYAYATSPGTRYSSRQMLVIGLSPLVMLSVAMVLAAIAFPGLAPYAAVVFIGNFAGAIGDVWISSRLGRFRTCKDVQVVDLRDGVAVYTPDPRAKAIAQKLQRKDDGIAWGTRFFTAWIGYGLGITAGTFLVLAAISMLGVEGARTLGVGELHFLEYTNIGQEKSFGVNFIGIILLTVPFAIISSARAPKK